MKKLGTLLLACLMIFTIVGQCADISMAAADDIKAVTVDATLEPPTLDPHNTVESNAMKILTMTNEGLVRNKNGEIIPGLAETWEVSEDGCEYTFHLRQSTWEDGTAVNAYDFEYAFLRVIDPESAYEQAESAYALFENAREYHTGDIKDPALVGVKAVDEYTLTIKTPTPGVETLSTLTRYPWVPINKTVAEEYGLAYGSEADKLISNGPFKVTEWSHNEKIVIEKNDNYWNKDEIKLDKVTFMVTQDAMTAGDMLMSGILDYMTTSNSDVMRQMVDMGFAMESYTSNLQCLVMGGDYEGSQTLELFQNMNFVKALNVVINRKAITDTLFTGGIPAYRLSTPSTMGVNAPFVEEYPFEAWDIEGDTELAKQYLETALTELGKTVEELPAIRVVCYESPTTLLVIQAVQDMVKRALGIEIAIEQYPIQQMFSMVFSGNFDLWWSGMSVGTMDWGSPDGFLPELDWRNPSYTGGWHNEDFARYYDIVRTTSDMKERKDALFEIEKILVDENPPFILVAYTQTFVCYDASLTGPDFTSFDDITFMDIVK